MGDDLTVPELGRMFQALRQDVQAMAQGLNTRLDKLVSTEVYTLQKKHTDDRLDGMARDLQKVRDERDALENAFEAYQLQQQREREQRDREDRDRRERERQARLYQLIVPVLFGVLSLAVAVWAVVAKS